MTDYTDILTACRNWYETNPSGGVLHICLDDGNMDEGNVWWCLREAAQEKNLRAVQIAAWLLTFSEDERFDLYDKYDQYAC